jgi:DNA helicase-2/ATP-dependent DNA helicase PcrA
MKFLENKAQSLAVEATEGPVLLISCPGSGKTTTLIRRIHRILKNGAVPGSILMVTFTNAASRDMQKRYFELYGKNPGITFQTIHSLAFNILRAEGRYDRDSLLSVQGEREFFLHLLRKNRWISDPFELSQAVMTEISGLRNNDTPLKGYQPLSCSRDVFEQLYYAYARFKEDRRRIDFDDILFEARRLLSVNRDALEKWQRRFRYILCDEYQDTNVIQKDILTLLASQDRNLCVVGDDDQSIYAFRGARPDIMLAFPGEFPGANVIKMGDNYRSALTIVQTADRLIRHNRKRFSKECRSVRGQNGAIGSVTYLRYPSRQKEAEGLIRLIRKLTEAGTELKDMAVLFRTNRQIRLIQGNLERSGIPSRSTEAIRNLYDGWIFRDIVSYARLAFGDGSKDDMLRVLNHPARYLKEEAFAGADFSYRGMRRAIAYLKADAYWKYQAADDALRDWIDLLGPGSLTEDDPPAKLFELLTGPRSIRYQEYLDDYASFRNTDPDEFYEELDELKADALMFRSLRDWFRHAASSVGKRRGKRPTQTKTAWS